MTKHASIRRIDDKATQFGEWAFSDHFANASQEQVVAYLHEFATNNADTITRYEIHYNGRIVFQSE